MQVPCFPPSASQTCAIYTSKLAELEAAIEKRKSNIRFYTPSAPIIGLNSGDLLDHPPVDHQYAMQQEAEEEMASDVEREDEMNELMEDQSQSEYLDVMNELEDSTDG